MLKQNKTFGIRMFAFILGMLLPLCVYAQKINVSGVVRDAVGGVPGASIIEKGTTNGAIADVFVLPTGWNGRETARHIYDILEEKGYASSMRCIATGYGRVSVDYADKVITEITCHGKGGWALFGQNGTIVDIGGQVLCISQFTLLGDARHGRRPSFIKAARPEVAEPLFEECCQKVRDLGIHVETGRFRTHMEVSLVNDGPVTILLDSKKGF